MNTLLPLLSIPILALVLYWCIKYCPPNLTHCEKCGTKLEKHSDGGLQMAHSFFLNCPKCDPNWTP